MLRSGALLGGGLAAAGLVGCNDGSGGGGGGNSGGGSGEPKTGGTLRFRIPTDPPSLDIHQVSTYVAVWPEAPAYNQLIQYDPDDSTQTTLIPDLATALPEQPDETTYVFTLQEGITFHDGKPLTAEDVKATLEWIKSPPEGKPSPRANILASVSAIETPDDKTVTLKLSKPNPSILPNLASHYFAIGPKHVLDASGDLGKDLIGTGPFKLSGYQSGVSLKLERNPNYFRQGRPYLDGVEAFIIRDENTALANFQAGQLQMMFPIDAAQIEDLRRELGDQAEIIGVPSYTRIVLFPHAGRDIFKDKRVRQALSMAIDRQAGIDVAMSGSAQVGAYMHPDGQWALPEDILNSIPGYGRPDVEGAKRLLSEAGISTPHQIRVLTRNDFEDTAVFVQDQLSKIGFDAQLDLRDSAAAYDAAYAGDFDLIVWHLSIAIDDPDAVFGEYAISEAPRNWSQVRVPAADDLFLRQSQTLDQEERKSLVNELERTLLEEFQSIQLFYQIYQNGVWNSVKDYTFHPSLYTNRRFDNVWLA
jgi:peptide/nickel transport system substrate-binding protein